MLGGALIFVAGESNALVERGEASGSSGEPLSRSRITRWIGRAKYSPKAAVTILFLFVSAITLAPIVHYAASLSKSAHNGLLGKYFRNANWSGEPVDVQVDPLISFDWSKSWPLPAPFSVEWTGNIAVEQSGNYTFALIADDGAFVEIDRKIVVDVRQGPLLQEKNGIINLSSGLHPIRVRYFNTLFGGSVKLYWSLIGRPKEIVPSEVLLPDIPPGSKRP
jgi:hypothetical protein